MITGTVQQTGTAEEPGRYVASFAISRAWGTLFDYLVMVEEPGGRVRRYAGEVKHDARHGTLELVRKVMEDIACGRAQAGEA